jgi:hypothetical protein
MLSRRAFLASTASLAVTVGITGSKAAMGPNDKFDLLSRAATCSIPVSHCAGDATSAFGMALSKR